jgi:hypothetical protein
MTDPRQRRELDPDTVAFLEEIQTIQGDELPVDQDAVLDPDQIEGRRLPSQTEIDDGATVMDPSLLDGPVGSLDGLALDELRDGETDDPKAAAEEGLTYVPPSDPVFRSDADATDGIQIAAGAAVDALDEPYDDDHRTAELSAEGDVNSRIRDALEADAATTGLVDRLVIAAIGSRVVVRGVVDDVDDADTVVAVIERVAGVDEVIDETELAEV